ncbi:MAG: stage 0 sporulation protein [Candidatus Bipolaricaulota bacterium]|nr:stage 0 sporulation protein [Candidatus Bipolaricaulota bacterium]
MAAETLGALVRRWGPARELHPAAWGTAVGEPGETWVEEEGSTLWLAKVLKSPLTHPGTPRTRLVRRATDGDWATYRTRAREAEELRRAAQGQAAARSLPMRFVGAELDLGRTYLRLHFTAPDRVDFRELLRELGGSFRLRIELHQVGPRDAAKFLGEVGLCGRPLCCRTFLHKLRPVPLELAFEQGLSLNPERLTGVCGRLTCCLLYEHEQYREALEGMPKLGTKVQWGGRTGKVVALNVFQGTFTVQWPDGTRSEHRGTAPEDGRPPSG